MKNYLGSPVCGCGRVHDVDIDDVIIGKGVISQLPETVKKYGSKKVFLLADVNTYEAAGKKVEAVLRHSDILFSPYVFADAHLEPDEKAIGSAVLHFDHSCDMIVAVGSGVINDIGKVLSRITGRHYMIVATAPSMDGYASASSSLVMDGLKVTLDTRCADVIVGDIDILKQAPEHMLKSGLGDILAKYVSITEWRIGHVVTGEYYCEKVAELVRSAVKKCIDNAPGLLKREEKAIEAVFEGLVISGVAMAYVGSSRPASGLEHYFSHVWDMRGLEFGTRVDLHGIQCAMGTMQAVKLYEALKHMVPCKEKAFSAVETFDYENWCVSLRSFLGKSAETVIAQEQREHKYDKASHPERFRRISENWDTILQIIEQELPTFEQLSSILNTIGISPDPSVLGIDTECTGMTFRATKDIRNKYILSRLAWDLGILDELCAYL